MKKNKKAFMLFFSVFIFILLLKVYFIIGDSYNIFIPCVFHEITGLDCPGCGITRMIEAFLELDFYQAFRYNPFIFILSPFIVFYFVDYFIKFCLEKNNYLYLKINKRVWIILLIFTILFGIFRNIPYFDFLKPTIV